jgi:hypothetical protein
MTIITSAAYVSPELVTEFGRLPPSMLPVQNKRLFQHQLEILTNRSDVIISLPFDFVLTERDRFLFKEYKVIPVYVPLGLSLGQSIVYVLNVSGKHQECVHILHGDTLFKELPDVSDVCIVSEYQDNYCWVHSSDGENVVYAGYFSFSNQSLLIKKITENNYSFIDGFKAYSKEILVKEVHTDFWLDFGLVNSYYRSKSFLTTQRIFNDLMINRFSVIKSSDDKKKILAEAKWFKNLPVDFKPFLPSFWDYWEEENKSYYQIEYFYLNTLSDLYVFGNQPLFVWKNILKACNLFIISCLNCRSMVDKELFNDRMYKEKTFSRLKTYSLKENINLDETWIINGIGVPSLNDIVLEMNGAIANAETKHLCISHGDFCFSNILYNFKTQSIKVIDPRGLDAFGEETIYGDVRYDVAKLAHSVLGLYDYIIGGCFFMEETDKYTLNFNIQTEPRILEIQEYFKTLKFGEMNLNELSTYPILVVLFLSMLPLHNDHPLRQKAFLANALKLYIEYKSLSSKTYDNNHTNGRIE